MLTTRPLFAGYIFARFDPADATNVATVRQTRGVLEILSLDGAPAAIPDAEIANLQRLAANPGAVLPCAYVAGEAVTVARGPFAGVSGVVSRVRQGGNTSATTLTIPIQILGRAVRVEIDAADVEPTE